MVLGHDVNISSIMLPFIAIKMHFFQITVTDESQIDGGGRSEVVGGAASGEGSEVGGGQRVVEIQRVVEGKVVGIVVVVVDEGRRRQGGTVEVLVVVVVVGVVVAGVMLQGFIRIVSQVHLHLSFPCVHHQNFLHKYLLPKIHRKKCYFFRKGKCKNGEACSFLHEGKLMSLICIISLQKIFT